MRNFIVVDRPIPHTGTGESEPILGGAAEDEGRRGAFNRGARERPTGDTGQC